MNAWRVDWSLKSSVVVALRRWANLVGHVGENARVFGRHDEGVAE